MFAGLTQRFSTRVAVVTLAVALFFVLCMGAGAWVVASGMLRAQAQRHLAELARVQAVQAAGLLEMVVGEIAQGRVFAGRGATTVVVGGLDLGLRRLGPGQTGDWNKAALTMGLTTGRLVSQGGGVVEILSPPSAPGGEAVVWTLALDQLGRRLGANGGDGELSIRSGGHTAQAFWGAPLTLAGTTAEADVMLPNGFGRGQMTLRLGADSAGIMPFLDRNALWLSLIAVSAVMLAAGVAIVTSRRLTRALSQLADAATSFDFAAEDKSGFHLDGDDEIARLGKAFAAMVERLEGAYRDLDRRSQVLLSNAERVAQVGSAIWRPGQSRQMWSDQFHAILGLDPAEVSPSREAFFEHVHHDDRARLAQVLAEALQPGQGRVVEDFRIVRGDGVERVVQFRAEVAYEDDAPIRVDATIQDITERKRMEEQLDGVVRDLKRSNEELEQFAYVASHDLRQPLRTVRSYLTLIEDAIDDKLDPETREFMDFIRDGVKRMDSLITDLLTYSRVGRRVADGPVDVGRMIDLSLLDLQAQIDETQAQIKVPSALPVIEGDAGGLTRLFQNLIGNALKYRKADQVPHIEVGCRDRGRGWEFSVADNGIGIAPEHRERAFGIFQRLHGRHEYEGTGIGLAICRKIVERKGGNIWVEDNAGGGAVFRFTWPKIRRAAAPRR